MRLGSFFLISTTAQLYIKINAEMTFFEQSYKFHGYDNNHNEKPLKLIFRTNNENQWKIFRTHNENSLKMIFRIWSSSKNDINYNGTNHKCNIKDNLKPK